MSQCIMDIKREQLHHSRTYSPISNYHHPHDDVYGSGVLDLSRPSSHRRDSVETCKTPSPSNGSSFSSNEGSPLTNHGSPSSTSITIRGNLHQQQQEQLSPKSMAESYENAYSPHILKRESSPPVPAQQCGIFSTFAMNPSVIPAKNRNTPSPNLKINSPPTTPQTQKQQPHHELHQRLDNTHHLQQQIQSNDRFFLQNKSNYLQSVEQHNLMNQNDSSNDAIPDNFIANAAAAAAAVAANQKSSGYPMVIGRDGKLSRPFKAYPHDPLSIAASFTATDNLLDTQSTEKYNTFRKRMLEQIHAANGGQPTVSNPKMRRTPSKSTFSDSPSSRYTDSPTNISNNNNDITTTNHNNDSNGSTFNSNGNVVKDSAYFERRKKNNAAAKKSRDRRRIKEDEIAIRAAFLERENIELKFELAAARKQLALYGVTTLT